VDTVRDELNGFTAHLAQVGRDTEAALAQARKEGADFDGIVFHAGTRSYYHADDRPVHFRPTPHFARFAPVAGPDHLLLFRPGERPKLARVVPRDYWYEPPGEPDHPYARALDVVQVDTLEAAQRALGDVARCAYVGSDARVAGALGFDARAVEPAALLAPLDWARATKTPYEIECIREAAAIAARGHRAVRAGVRPRHSERRMHADYLEACGLLEAETPYNNIIAWDECAATLHYETKRTTPPNPGHVLLVDAGASHHGYASDITRTYVNDGVHATFRALLDGMESLQRDLVGKVRPGQSFIELHAAAHRAIAALLCEAGVLRAKPAEAFARGLSRPFFPHGLGHHLGLQVHDIGGRQVSPAGERRDPPPESPYLRTTRPLEAGHVVTIEPGLYFIPMLLEPYRTGADAGAFDWKLIDALVSCGGIRIEDDVRVTDSGVEDLTRPVVPGHRAA
jgi:Xaa-Pro dipeptidase